MRSHSVSAEGGTAAVLFEDEGDTIESHIYDTVKGSDFLADQDVAERLCKEMPGQIYQMDRWGMPWSRRPTGRIDQRAFGGYSFPRATYASDKVGFFEMQTLYDTCQKHDNIEYLNEWFVTSIVHDGRRFHGITAIELASGTFLRRAGQGHGDSHRRGRQAVQLFHLRVLFLLPTASTWPTGRGWASRTWSSCSSTRPGYCRRAY